MLWLLSDENYEFDRKLYCVVGNSIVRECSWWVAWLWLFVHKLGKSSVVDVGMMHLTPKVNLCFSLQFNGRFRLQSYRCEWFYFVYLIKNEIDRNNVRLVYLKLYDNEEDEKVGIVLFDYALFIQWKCRPFLQIIYFIRTDISSLAVFTSSVSKTNPHRNSVEETGRSMFFWKIVSVKFDFLSIKIAIRCHLTSLFSFWGSLVKHLVKRTITCKTFVAYKTSSVTEQEFSLLVWSLGSKHYQ